MLGWLLLLTIDCVIFKHILPKQDYLDIRYLPMEPFGLTCILLADKMAVSISFVNTEVSLQGLPFMESLVAPVWTLISLTSSGKSRILPEGVILPDLSKPQFRYWPSHTETDISDAEFYIALLDECNTASSTLQKIITGWIPKLPILSHKLFLPSLPEELRQIILDYLSNENERVILKPGFQPHSMISKRDDVEMTVTRRSRYFNFPSLNQRGSASVFFFIHPENQASSDTEWFNKIEENIHPVTLSNHCGLTHIHTEWDDFNEVYRVRTNNNQHFIEIANIANTWELSKVVCNKEREEIRERLINDYVIKSLENFNQRMKSLESLSDNKYLPVKNEFSNRYLYFDKVLSFKYFSCNFLSNLDIARSKKITSFEAFKYLSDNIFIFP